jgi:exodeoxyribonuclease V alpha subunit
MAESVEAPVTREGVLERVLFRNEQNDWTVARLRAAEGARSEITIVGALPALAIGEHLRVTGRFVEHRRYGSQLQVESFQPLTPDTADGIRRFLSSGVIEGIGKKLARSLVDHFGAETLDVLDRRPERLAEIPRLGRRRREGLVEAWARERGRRDAMIYLMSLRIGSAHALRIVREWGSGTVARVRANPYELAEEIDRIGFKTADAVARAQGVERDAPIRMDAGVRHVLAELQHEGHVYSPREGLARRAAEVLGDPGAPLEREPVEAALERGVRAGRLLSERGADGEEGLFLPAFHAAEVEAAARLRAIGAGRPPFRGDAARALAAAEARQHLRLTAGQREALLRALTSPLAVITGGPGVGKTTILRTLVRVLWEAELRVGLGAPTGRAAQRMTEATGADAKTLHRLLKFNPEKGRFEHDADQPLEADQVIVDETSMLDLPLLVCLLRAMPKGAGLLFLGDADQLPSVGPGRVLRDLIESGRVPTARLDEIFRQQRESRIVESAHRINRGETPALDSGPGEQDFYFVPRRDGASALETIREIVKERIPARFRMDPIRDVQVLTPMYRGEVGADNLNRELQAALNPPGPPEFEAGGRVLRQGDRVMQLVNDYDKEVFNGDVGRITGANRIDRSVRVDFDGLLVEYTADELDALTHAYAISVHKSQGSEYPAVVLPLTEQHYVMLQRNLLYTAVTRGKRLVVLVGTRRALEIAVRNDRTAQRYTRLMERLREGGAP